MVINKGDIRLIRSSLRYVKSYKKNLLLIFCLIIFSVAFGLFQPLFLGGILENITSLQFSKSMYLYIFLYVILDIFTMLISTANQIISLKTSANIGTDIKNKIYLNIMNIKMKHFDETSVGEFISRLEGDTSEFANIVTNKIVYVLVSILKTICIGIIVFRINFVLASIVLLTFPLSYFINNKFGKLIRKESEEFKTLGDKYYGYVNQSIAGIKYIKINRIYDENLHMYKRLNNDLRDKNIHISLLNIISNVLVYIATNIDTIFILILGVNYIKNNVLSVQMFTAFTVYASQFSGGLQNITGFNVTLQQIMVSLERMLGVLENFKFEKEVHGDKDINFTDEEIIFENVSFSYESDKEVLNNLSFNIKENNLTVIMGKSGEGKSTILNLLASIYDVNEGQIKIGNYNIKDLSNNFFKENIYFLSQESFLFNLSIRENFRLIVPEAQDEDIIRVCKKACIYDYVKSLEKGLDTVIGDKLSNLSYGQYKRLNLAICLLKDCPIILMDEITTGLDKECKDLVLETIEAISKSKKVILVSHDLDVLKIAKNVFKLENGKMLKYTTD